MAVTNKGANWLYTDQAVTVSDIKYVYSICITPTANNAVLVLQDNKTGGAITTIDLRVTNSHDSKQFNFKDAGALHFPSGLKVSTVTNCVVTLVVSQNNQE